MSDKLAVKLFLAALCVLHLLAGLTCVSGAKLVRVKLDKKQLAQKGPLGQSVTSYYVNVNIGTPSKEFKLLVDVNAREVWVPHYSHAGLVLGRLNYKSGYSKKDSTTSVKEEKEIYTIAYKTSEFSGKAYRDLVEFLNVVESIQPARFEQRFLAISSASNDHFTRYGVDGVLAVNPWPLSETGSEMVSVALVRAKLMDELKVGLALTMDDDENSTDGGEITFGGFNPTKFLGALRYHEVINQHAWEVVLNGVMLGHESIACANDKCSALISTTSNDIYGPPANIKKVLKFFGHDDIESTFDEKRLYEIDCLKVVQAPTITFVINDAYYVLHPSSYIRKKTDGLLFKSQSCYIAILSNGSTNKWELGTNFLANYYTVFDLNMRRIAFGIRT